MDCLKIIDEARRAGLVLMADGDQLRIRGPKSKEQLVKVLLDNKTDVLNHIRTQTHGAVTVTETPSNSKKDGVSVTRTGDLPPNQWLRRFDWDTSPGYFPTPPTIRHGIHHKRQDCTSREFWTHVWGDRVCIKCWPPTDPTAIAAPEPDSPDSNGVS